LDYPPNKNYEVVLNGVVVGTVEATGDLEVDKLVIMDFLKQKGLYEQFSEIKAMYRQLANEVSCSG
jgi:hypothetical protein